jgi:hypothetical protein
MTAELCPTCGIWWRGVEHSCRLPYFSTTTGGFDPALSCGHGPEIAALRYALGVIEADAPSILGWSVEDHRIRDVRVARATLAAAKGAEG